MNALQLLPNYDVGKRTIDLTQRSIAHTGKTAKQPQIELPVSGAPSVIAAGCRSRQNGHQSPRCKFTKIVPPKGAPGLAEEFDAAHRATAERIQVTRPASLHAHESVPDVRRPELGIQSSPFGHGNARKANTGSSVTPPTWPARFSIAAQVRPVIALCVIARIFKCDAFRHG